MTAEKISKGTPKLLATSVEIWCPDPDCCETVFDPIPSPTGSFIWTELPETVTCRNCGKTFKVGKRITL